MELHDKNFGKIGANTVLTHVCKYGTTRSNVIRVRIRVTWNSYASQSFATAEIMNERLEWTHLIDSPSDAWHQPAATEAEMYEVMSTVAKALEARAEAVLR